LEERGTLWPFSEGEEPRHALVKSFRYNLDFHVFLAMLVQSTNLPPDFLVGSARSTI
jgi:hypothetical protein